jgi:cytochrome P450
MLFRDPPEHTRLRRLVAKAFTIRTVARLRPRIEDLTDGLLDALACQERADLLTDFAGPLPIMVICEWLGVPSADRAQFVNWTKVIALLAKPAQAAEAAEPMRDYLTELVMAKVAEPGDDLLSELAHMSDEAGPLNEHELVAMAFLLLFAGHETPPV